MKRKILLGLAILLVVVSLLLIYQENATGGDSYPQPQYWRYRGGVWPIITPTIQAAGISVASIRTPDTAVNSLGITGINGLLSLYQLKIMGRVDGNQGKSLDSLSGYGLSYTNKVSGYYQLSAMASTGINVNNAGISLKYDTANFSANAGSGLLIGPSLSLYSTTSTRAPLALRGTHSGDRLQCYSVSGVKGFYVKNDATPYGSTFSGTSGYATFSGGTFSVGIFPFNGTRVVFGVTGFNGQTGNLQAWADSSGVVLAYVTPRGAASFKAITYPPQSAALATTGNEGLTAYANSTNWNPGSGRGLYCVSKNGVAVTLIWKKLW